MPLASAIAAVVGVALTFWRRLIGFVRRIFTGRVGKTPPESASLPGASPPDRPADD
jgi:hypothetical protein